MYYSLDDIRAAVVPIIQQDAKDLHRIIVFGSYATGNQTPESDLDLYVDGRFEYHADEVKDTEQRISEVLAIPVDLITRIVLANSVVKDKLEQSIEEEGYLLYG